MTRSGRLPVAVAAVLVALSVGGCAAIKRVIAPPPPAPTRVTPARETPARETPVRVAPPPATAPVRATPPREEPPPGRAIPVPETPPPPVLSPGLGDAEADRLRREAQARIEGVELRIRPIDPRMLGTEQQEQLASIGSFISKAKAALAAQDPAQALNLAEKARILSDDLAGRLR